MIRPVTQMILISVNLALLSLLSCHQQVTHTSELQAVNSLFQTYDSDSTPGYALGIIQDGELVYQKGYGLGNLELGKGLDYKSAFYIGSMAKQFTTAALLILEAEGKVELDEEVRTYLPEFPNYGKSITLNHLIHHTSGLRETNSLQLFQGVNRNFEAIFDTEDLYQLILHQKQLNFTPGSEFRYSSGGYVVLAKIVEAITGKPFRQYVQERIFDPLSMEHTLVSDNHNEIIPNRVMSYWPAGNGGFERRSQLFDAYGDGGIITTVEDLAKWDRAFYEDLLGVPDFATKMYLKGILNSGLEIEYARGLQVREYKGLQMITHNGGMLGFRVDMVRFPEMRTTIILLGNSADFDPTSDILKIADIWLEGEFSPRQGSYESDKRESKLNLPLKRMNELEGFYWTDETNYFQRIFLRNDSLFLDRGDERFAMHLLPLGDGRYSTAHAVDQMELSFGTKEGDPDLVIKAGVVRRSFRKFDPTPPETISHLDRYIGRYHSSELETGYRIYREGERLILRINRNKPLQIYPLESGSGMVWNGKQMLWIGFGEIKFDLSDNEEVRGFTIGDSRVGGVYFAKD